MFALDAVAVMCSPASAKLVGATCRAGDRIVVYDIVSTVPEGDVRVTDKTLLRFDPRA